LSTLRFPDPALWDRIESHLSGTPSDPPAARRSGGRFAFAFTRSLPEGPEGPVLVVEDVELVHDGEVSHDASGWTIAAPTLDRVHHRAVVGRHGLVQFHAHQLGPPHFTPATEAGLLPTVDHLADLLDERPYAAVVWSGGAVHAEWFRRRAGGIQRGTFRSVAVLGDRLVLPDARWAHEDRFRRQVPLLGRPGQAALRRLRVGVVGQGGTGSHAVMQLAYLGVRDLLLLDDDVVDPTSLNRLVTAERADVGAPKTLVARRRVLALDHEASVRVLPGLEPHRDPVELAEADLVIGCVDDDGPRYRLNRLAVDAAVPYLDIGTGVDPGVKPPALGARLSFVLPGGPCLTCTAELDATEVARWHQPGPRRTAAGTHRYGVEDPTGPAPSVVHLNGLAVSTALAEVVAWVSGARPPALRLDVDLNGDPDLPGRPRPPAGLPRLLLAGRGLSGAGTAPTP
jgi:hypothetical protein